MKVVDHRLANRKHSLTGFQREPNGELWLWDDLPQLEMEVGYKTEAAPAFNCPVM